MEFIGWVGSIMLSVCGLPQAWESFKTKHSDGISWGFILLWLFGEIFALVYVIHKKEYPIIFNCVLNTLIVSVIFYYKWKNYYFRKNLLKLIVRIEKFYLYGFNLLKKKKLKNNQSYFNMAKRKIYELDEKVFRLIEKTIDRLVIAKEGIHIYNDNGRIFLFRNELHDESKNIRAFLDKGEKLETTYEFSKEYSVKVRELVFNKIDEIDTSWKEENAKVEAYLKEERDF